MAQNNNILQELRELESSLANMAVQNIYSVPEGYFEGLAPQVLNRIKAMEATTAIEELYLLSPVVSALPKQVPYTVPFGYFEALAENSMQLIRQTGLSAMEETANLSPLLGGLDKQMPYTVPQGYFNGIEERMLKAVTGAEQTAKEELESISPLLSGLKKEMPFSVPQGYFENMAAAKPKEQQTAKVISFSSRKWFKYAAAAILVGVIATTSVLLINNKQPDSFAKFEKKLNKEIKKTSDKELDEFIKYADASQGLVYNEPKEEVKALLKDVPVSELQGFLDEIADPEIVTDEPLEME
ncbi:MAG: hypothetical protein J0L56_09755 [Chitinophagales bacterium]|nr:hypothetical protein [Chitinophagales bacterium]